MDNMSSRKRPFAEVSQSRFTPSRNGPSTPHAIRALQQRSGARTRSARSVRQIGTDTVRPDSIRDVLRRFAKISAPITKKRVVTPRIVAEEKENEEPNVQADHDNDSVLLNKPNLTFDIEETLDEDDSDLPVAPTPSVLPDDNDNDYEQPTITFRNVASMTTNGRDAARVDRRKSYVSFIQSEPIGPDEDEDDQENDFTILTERGRRALSEEATGRLSRYSFGSIRMSDFGSQLEFRRDSNKDQAVDSSMLEPNDYVPLHGDDIDFGETENLRRLQESPGSEIENDTEHASPMGDDTFRLDVPNDEALRTARDTHAAAVGQDKVYSSKSSPPEQQTKPASEVAALVEEIDDPARHHTVLETATAKSQISRKKRVKLTRHGTIVPSLPTSLIRRIVFQSYEKQSKRKPALGRDHIKALEQATEWFFDQVGEDLAAYSSHGRRKRRVNTDDVLLLMKRQKVLDADTELEELARNWLPREVIEELDLSDAV